MILKVSIEDEGRAATPKRCVGAGATLATAPEMLDAEVSALVDSECDEEAMAFGATKGRSLRSKLSDDSPDISRGFRPLT